MTVDSAAWAALFSAGSWALASILFGRLLCPSNPDRPSAASANLFKNILALLVFLLIWAVRGGEWPGASDSARLIWSGGLGFAVGDTLWFAAIPLAGLQVTAMTCTLLVPCSAFLAWVFMGETISPTTMGAMLIVLFGVQMVIREPVAHDDEEGAGDPARRRLGLLLALACMLSQSVALVTGHSASAEVGVLPGSIVRTAGGVGAGLLLAPLLGLLRASHPRLRSASAVPMAWWQHPVEQVRDLFSAFTRPRILKSLLVASLFGSVLCLLPFYLGLRDLKSGIATVLFTTTPLFTLPISYLFGERHGWRGILGTLIGFVGVVLVVLSS